MYYREATYKFLLSTSLFYILVVCGATCFAQNQIAAQPKSQPKIGLALSGGGAKGLAYIGLLKKIDSLGIKVSYITGTSMGGVIGSLYAMGYSGRQLEDIVKRINWNLALSNNVPLSQINIEEKDEYGRYLLELPIHKGKPSIPISIIEGQYLSEVLNTYTYPARNITDFSKLFIPLQITTSNIIDGKVVMQKSGSLPLAMRATMAIPAVFTSVYIDDKILVDGGVTRNYPAAELRNMGADYVIGGYTGFHLLKEKELESPFNLLMQTMSFGEVEDFGKQKSQTNLLIDYTEVLAGISAADFSRYNKIMKRGEIEAEKYLPQLIKIAEQQKADHNTAAPQHFETAKTPVVKYNFITNRNKQITDTAELDMLQHVWKLDTGKYYDAATVNNNIREIFGTRFYDKVFYTFNNGTKGLEMDIHLKKGTKGHFKTAVHYDTDQSAGIILNYTYYNLLFNRSRFLVTVDATERFKVRTNYYKFISPDNKLWVRGDAEYRNLKSNDLLLSLFSVKDLNSPPPDYFIRSVKTSASVGYSFNHSMYAQAGISYELEDVYKAKSIVSKVIGVDERNTVYRHYNEAFFLKFVQNSTSSAYYPVSGNKLESEFKYTFDNRLKLNNIAGTDTNEIDIYQYLNPQSNLYTPKGLPGNITRFYVKDEIALPLTPAISLKIGVLTGFNSSSRFGANGNNFFYLNNNFGLGGTDQRDLYSNQGFIGLRQGELPFRGLTAFNFSAQYNPIKNIYFIPMLSYAAESNGYNTVANLFKKGHDNIGYGLHLGYMSVIGPVDFVISKSTIVNEISLPWRAYLSLGYKF
ncbi:patatin-like phospholipase family protein [Mucilaginibacter gilvus]|uniref:Patatin n=1 Tax=Mucilaginibacter gilvus TaxID=2305909 RepID=A0A3S3UUC4_9SPHI|nr:patatin-like phospholipase family protein [Mucilaginibacter gilvus]RWY48377.1 patatin [Mucilaginibacter gilvus]